FGVLIALALIFSYIESLIPLMVLIPVPGIKLGLPNLIVLIALYKMGVKEAYLLSVVRVILAGFIFGNMFSILYSLAGGLLSLTVMALLKRSDKFSVLGISTAGGVMHNAGQLLVAIAALETVSIAYYFPVLLISGLVTGLLIGVIANETLSRLTFF
ncbi:MAG: Gx transporter family protein, partial [Hespellia sp.]|nr:Gx transporter family protein [Hespellia sp.]